MKSLGINYLVNCAKETSYPNSFQLDCLTLDAVNMFRFGERMKDGKCMIKGREFSNKATRENFVRISRVFI